MLKDKKNSKGDTIELTLIDDIGIRKNSTTKVSVSDLQNFFHKAL